MLTPTDSAIVRGALKAALPDEATKNGGCTGGIRQGSRVVESGKSLWASTTLATSPAKAWAIGTSFGEALEYGKSNGFQVLCLRNGE